MADQVLDLFKIRPDFDLNLMQKNQTLGDLTRRLFPKMEKVLQQKRPDVVVVQGDTTTAFAVALKAFYERVPVAHVEAGLRSHNKYQPFPEEMNRCLISRLADFHFVPTEEARQNLLCEGIEASKIQVTGNTIVDALRLVRVCLRDRRHSLVSRFSDQNKIILVTAHRRESFGKPLESICCSLKRIAANFPDVRIVFPVHLNPRVQRAVHSSLGKISNILLVPPLPYIEFLALLQKSYLVLTDSGGVQEEAPSFGKPVLVLREVTERREALGKGLAKLVGTSEKKIYREASRLLRNPAAYRKMVGVRNPFGDGRASERILARIAKMFAGQSPAKANAREGSRKQAVVCH
jgi:UDP-N-acetylglucosamine 2-epimerase (non-hydrolysing)